MKQLEINDVKELLEHLKIDNENFKVKLEQFQNETGIRNIYPTLEKFLYEGKSQKEFADDYGFTQATLSRNLETICCKLFDLSRKKNQDRNKLVKKVCKNENLPLYQYLVIFLRVQHPNFYVHENLFSKCNELINKLIEEIHQNIDDETLSSATKDQTFKNIYHRNKSSINNVPLSAEKETYYDGTVKNIDESSINESSLPAEETHPAHPENIVNNLVENVRKKVELLIVRDCDEIRCPDGEFRDFNKFHIKISCRDKDANSQNFNDFASTYFAAGNIKPLVLLGKPGSGKTNSLKYLAMSCIKGDLFPNLVPFYFKLRRNNLNDLNIFDLIVNTWNPYKVSELEIKEILQAGNLLLLLDGLDEVRSDYRFNIEERIAEFTLYKYPLNKSIISCRSVSANSNDTRYCYITINNLSFEEIKGFIHAFYEDYIKISGKRNSEADTKLIEQINTPQLIALAQIPFNLTLICSTFFKNSEDDENCQLKNKRYKLYEDMFENLVNIWNLKKNIKLPVYQIENFFLYLAKTTFNKEKDFKLDSYFNKYVDSQSLGKAESDKLKEAIEHRGCLLIKEGNKYSFEHFTWHEYFVARSFANQIIDPNQKQSPYNELFTHIHDIGWYEIFLFLREMLEDVGKADEFLTAMKNWINTNPEFQKSKMLQYILKQLRETARFYYVKLSTYLDESGFRIYTESGLRGCFIESIIDNYGNSLAAHLTDNLPYELMLNGYLERMLAITMKRDPEIEKSLRVGVCCYLDRILIPHLHKVMKLHEDAIDRERNQLTKAVPELEIKKEYIDKAIEYCDSISSDSISSDSISSIDDLKKELTTLRGELPEVFNENCDWYKRYQWTKKFREIIMKKNLKIAHDWHEKTNDREYIDQAIKYCNLISGSDDLKKELMKLRGELPEDLSKNCDWYKSENIRHQWAEELRKVMKNNLQIGYNWHGSEEMDDEGHKILMNDEEGKILKNYYNVNTVLAECINLTYSKQSKRNELHENHLLPVTDSDRP